MLREERTEVLVVGAGPVGMLTALFLARGGVKVRIIDQEARPTARTYACALHPHALTLLHQLGLVRAVLDQGRRVGGVAFYDGGNRRAEAKLSLLPAEYPHVLVIAQSAFESLLEQHLHDRFEVRVEWNHRLSELQVESHAAVARVDRMGISAKGYIIPEMDWTVEKTGLIRADYVVGSDGPNSAVSKVLGVTYERVGQPEFFAVYEFESDATAADELRVVLNADTASVLWPLSGTRQRWSFQLLQEHLAEFPAKERRSLVVGAPEWDKANQEFMRRLLRERAPWFQSKALDIQWSTDVEFQHRIANRFGNEHCWLAGDAAHQTGPAGMQSMNVGLAEAEQLATALVQILRSGGSTDLLETYNQDRQRQWHSLLGLSGSLKARPNIDPWVKERRTRILPCLPASGADLTGLLDQLKLELV